MLTKSAHSLPPLPSEVEFSKVSFLALRWPVLLPSEEITSITSRSITDSRRDIITLLLISPQLSLVLEPVTSSLLVNADQSLRPSDSTSLELRRRELKATSERPSSCSERHSSNVLAFLSKKRGSESRCYQRCLLHWFPYYRSLFKWRIRVVCYSWLSRLSF